MRGFVSSAREEDGSVPTVEVDGTVGVFRKDDDEGNVHLRSSEGDTDLGHHDISVSRLRPDGAPVRFTKDDGDVYVRNVDNTSTVLVNYLRSEEQLEQGEFAKIHDDCIVEPGYHTALEVTLESEDSPEDSTYIMIRVTCNGLNHAVRNSDHAALTYGNTLLKTMRERPVDDDEYNQYVQKLKSELDALEASEGLRDDDQLKDSRIKAVERLTSGIKDMYMFNE